MVDRVSPFSSPTDFFRPIYSGMDAEAVHEGENFACLRESINLFDFGQRGFTLISSGEDNALVLIERDGSDQTWSEIAWQVVKIATIIIPLIKLAGAAIYFLANDFELEVPQYSMGKGILEAPHVMVRGVKVKKANPFILNALPDDLVKRVLRYLGPACFQFAATTTQVYAWMNADPLLEKYRIGRDILKKCFSLEAMPNINVEERDRNRLLKNFCMYDLGAALTNANSNNCRIYDLALISDSIAKSDVKKSLEILEYAYSDVGVGLIARGFINGLKAAWPDEDYSAFYDLSKTLVRLIKCFVKTSDLDKTNRLIECAREDSQWELQHNGSICRELEIFSGFEYLKCREADTMAEEKANIYLNISRIHDLFEVLPGEANLLLEDLLEFLDKFIVKFPQGRLDRAILLLDLCDVLVKFDREKACEVVTILMNSAEPIAFIEPKHHIQYVKILFECGQKTEKEIKQAGNCIGDNVESKQFISNAVEFFEVLKQFNIISDDLFNFVERVSQNPNYSKFHAILTAAKIFVSYDKEHAFLMLNQAFNPGVIETFSANKKRFKPICTEVFKEIAKFHPLEAKEFVERFEDSHFKLQALTAVVEGIMESCDALG